jgi:hypothetical protein
MSDNVGVRVSEAMTAIYKDLPNRLNINSILQDALAKIGQAALPDVLLPTFLTDKLIEILREIATYTVEEFTRRTGQQFFWVDEVDPAEDGKDVLMSFSLDEKGNVRF